MDPSLLQTLKHEPFLPTVLPLESEVLCRYIEALHRENYPFLEILARPLDEAVRTIEQINASPVRSKIKLGIGTLRSKSDAQAAVALKPDFLVSPAFSRPVLKAAVEADIVYIPAVLTFQDVQNVLEAFEDVGREVKLLKLCPVERVSFKYIEVLNGCFPGITFCPTGSVTLQTMPQWRAIDCIGPIMERWFVSEQLLNQGEVEPIRQRLAEIREMDQVPS